MRTEHLLEALNQRIETLVSGSYTVSEAQRRGIADKFANKSLDELHELVRQLVDKEVSPGNE